MPSPKETRYNEALRFLREKVAGCGEYLPFEEKDVKNAIEAITAFVDEKDIRREIAQDNYQKSREELKQLKSKI